MRKRLLLLCVCAVLGLCGCTAEQTIVRKVNEPGELADVEQLTPVALPWENAQVIAVAPDNKTALLWQNDRLTAYRNGELTPVHASFDERDATLAADRMAWSPDCRYAVCYGVEGQAYVFGLEQPSAAAIMAQTACFNADQVTLYAAMPAPGGGSTVYRRKVTGEGQAEVLLTTTETLHGAMYRTTRNQYLVRGDNKLLCLEQANARQPWTARVVADFAPSGLTITDFCYSAQTALCIVSGVTSEGRMAFSVVSPDGKDFAIDKVSCFSPTRENPVENLPAEKLSILVDEAAYPAALKKAQLSPGGLYLLLWCEAVADGSDAVYLLNLDKGKLTQVELAPELTVNKPERLTWCAGKMLLFEYPDGSTTMAALSGWTD